MSHLDRPTDKDEFGFEPYVKGIEQLVRGSRSEDLPVTIGIYGPWGCGKTSFMYQLRKRLKGSYGGAGLPVVWFEAWKYDRSEDVRMALVYKILTDLRVGISKTSWGSLSKVNKAMRAAGSLAVGLAARSRVTVGVPVSGASVSMPSMGEMADYMRKAMGSLETAVDQFEDDFSGAVAAFLHQYAKGGGTASENDQRLVVFIDDLDRCLPDNVLVILEALKLFLHDSPCVFVIGVDREPVEKAIEARYKGALGICGRDYLDKIVQYSFSVPPVSGPDLAARFAEELILGNVDPEFGGQRILVMGAEENPRVYLRILSAWKVVAALAPNFGFDLHETEHVRCLAIATVIQVRFPGLYEACRKNEDGFGVFLGACRNPQDYQGGDGFSNTSAREFREFWEDGGIQRFFNNLRLRERLSVEEISGPGNLIARAFKLSGGPRYPE